jgi:hypothetical protein
MLSLPPTGGIPSTEIFRHFWTPLDWETALEPRP